MTRRVCWQLSAALCAAALSLSDAGSSRTVGAELRADLSRGRPDPTALRVVNDSQGCRVEAARDGLRVTIPESSAQPSPVGLELASWIRGDFRVTATYRLARLGPPRGGYGAGVGLTIELNEAGGPTLTIERQVESGGASRFVSTRITEDSAGAKQYDVAFARSSSDSRGRLRITRVGPVLETAVAEGEDDFRIVRRESLGTAEVRELRFACFNGQAPCELDVTLAELNLSADSLGPPGPRVGKGPSRAGWMFRFGMAVLVNLLLATALAVWRWPSLIQRARGTMPAAASATRDPDTTRPARWAWVGGAGLVTAVSLLTHFQAMSTVPRHTDERVWVERAYFYRLAVLHGDLDHPLWLAFDGIDAPHLGEFLAGVGLHLAGQPVPEVPESAAPWSNAPHPEGSRLRAARYPSALLGALVAPLLFFIGVAVTGRLSAGLVAGLCYAVHPLALLCEGRAMSEAGFQFFRVAAMALLVNACRRDGQGADDGPRGSFSASAWLLLLALGPAAVGLATAGKLTGLFTAAAIAATLGVLTLWGWFAGAREGSWRWLRQGVIYTAVFLGLCGSWTVLFNPTLYPDPIGGFQAMSEHRLKTGRAQAAGSPHWALATPEARFRAAWRNASAADLWGRPRAIGLSLLAIAGLSVAAAGEGARWRARRAPSPALAILIWVAVDWGLMVPALPLDWERYFLPLVPALTLGVGIAVTALTQGLARYTSSIRADAFSRSLNQITAR